MMTEDRGVEVEVHLLSQSSPIVICNVANTYTKDGLFCVSYNKPGHDRLTIDKFPLVNIFRVREEE